MFLGLMYAINKLSKPADAVKSDGLIILDCCPFINANSYLFSYNPNCSLINISSITTEYVAVESYSYISVEILLFESSG